MDVSFEVKIGKVFPYLNAKQNDPHAHLAKLINQYSKITLYRSPVIDENLNVVSRWGVKWWTRVLLNPVAGLLGYDLLASVRADRVAQGVLRAFQQAKIQNRAPLIRRIESDVIDRLNKKTDEKYQDAIAQVKRDFKKLFPEPVSERPEEPKDVLPDRNGFIWPPKLSDICVDEKLQAEVGQLYRDVIQSQMGSSPRIRRKEIFPGLDFRFFYNEKKELKDVQLRTNREFAHGKFRHVFLCYSLTKGQYFIKKNSPSQEERELLKRWVESPKRGLEHVFDIGRVSQDGDKGKEVWEIVERCRAGTLSTLFNTKPLVDPAKQKLLIEDLLCGLEVIHSQSKVVNFANAEGEDSEQETFLFHGDISPFNTLVDMESGEWRALLSDFDATGRFANCSGTPGFRSPETVRLFNKIAPGKDLTEKDKLEIFDFNFKYGQKKDMWSMGLVILSILCGRRGEGIKNTLPEGFKESGPRDIKGLNVPPLPCLERCLYEPKAYKTEVDAKVAELAQEDLDTDLEVLHEEYNNFHGINKGINANLWELVKGMLKVNPDARLSAEKALTLLQNE